LPPLGPDVETSTSTVVDGSTKAIPTTASPEQAAPAAAVQPRASTSSTKSSDKEHSPATSRTRLPDLVRVSSLSGLGKVGGDRQAGKGHASVASPLRGGGDAVYLRLYYIMWSLVRLAQRVLFARSRVPLLSSSPSNPRPCCVTCCPCWRVWVQPASSGYWCLSLGWRLPWF
jgi:hypothetical protein